MCRKYKLSSVLHTVNIRNNTVWQVFRVVYENKVVFADEMDRVLNPILSDRVIAYINGMEHRGFSYLTSGKSAKEYNSDVSSSLLFVIK